MRRNYFNRGSRRYRPPNSVSSQIKANELAEQYIRAAFFSANWEVKAAYFELYAKKYGSSSAAYARKTYPKWRDGITGMSSQTARRVLEIVPAVLSRSQKLELLHIYVPSFEKSLQERLRENFCRMESIPVLELAASYETAEKVVNNMSFSMGWFVKDVFSEVELEHLHNVLRWLMLTRLKESFTAVQDDLIKLHNACRLVTFAVHLDYQIKLLGIGVELTAAAGLGKLAFSPVFKMTGQGLEEDVKSLLRKKLVVARAEDKEANYHGRGKGVIAIHEVESALAVVERSDSRAAEIETTLEIEAQGGSALLNLEKKCPHRLIENVKNAELKRNIIVGIFAAGFIWWLSSGFFSFGFLVFFLVLGGPVLWGFWVELNSAINRANNERNQYEQSRQTVFAKKSARYSKRFGSR